MIQSQSIFLCQTKLKEVVEKANEQIGNIVKILLVDEISLPNNYIAKQEEFENDSAVCGNRMEGIEQMLALPEPPEVIILNDAFQHRLVKAKINIVLTAYKQLFTNDWLLPMGQLRDVVSRVQQADIVVVTKCPTSLSQSERSFIERQLQKKTHCPIVFATIAYDEQVFKQDEAISLSNFIKKPFTLVTGIANPQPLLVYLKEQGADFQHLNFPDHYHFSSEEVQQLQDKCILTTEKDYVRLQFHL